jgi:hypothetical protein
MKLFIAEEEKNNILNMYGIINEQTEDFSVPQGAIDAVRSIESKFSYMKDGVINGRTFKGDEKVNMLRNYMSETIGLDCWNNMSSKLKAQIYAFCFQADGDVPYKLKIIAGLANAIDSNVVRKDIVGKPLSDPAVQRAIQIIKNNCENINSYYDKYLSILDTQYKSMDYNDNYKNIWKFRPIAIEKIMSGQDVNKTLGEWSKFISGKLEPEQPEPKIPTSAEPDKTETPKPLEPAKTEIPKPTEPIKAVTSNTVEPAKTEIPKPIEPAKTEIPKPVEPPKSAVSKPAESPKPVAPNTPETKGPQRARIMTINPKDW